MVTKLQQAMSTATNNEYYIQMVSNCNEQNEYWYTVHVLAYRETPDSAIVGVFPQLIRSLKSNQTI